MNEQEAEHKSDDIESSENIQQDNIEENVNTDGDDNESLLNSKSNEKRPIRIGNVIKKELKSVRHEFKIKKVHMCSRLKRKADKLRKKKSLPEIKAKNEAHADALIEELRSSNHISVSKAAEFYMKRTKRDLLHILMNSKTSEPLERFLAKTGTLFNSVICRVIEFQAKFPNWKDILRIYFAKSCLKRTELLANYENIGPDTVLEICEDEENIEHKTGDENAKNQKCRKGKNKRVKLKNKENKNKSEISEDEMDVDIQHKTSLNVKVPKIDESNFDDSDGSYVSTNDVERISQKFPASISNNEPKLPKIDESNFYDSDVSYVSTNDEERLSQEFPASNNEPSTSNSQNSLKTSKKKSLSINTLVSESEIPISDLVPKIKSTSVCFSAEKYTKNTKRKISESDTEDAVLDLEPTTLIDTSGQLSNSNKRLNRSERRRLAKLNGDEIGSSKIPKNLKIPEIPEPFELKPDPFFVTKDDKDYLSHSSVKIPEYVVDEVKNTYKSKIPKPSTSFMNRSTQKRNDEFSLDNFNPKFKPPNIKRVSVSKFNSKIPPKTNLGKISTSTRYKNIGEKSHTLHPSWEAKKKISGITEFKGSKIVFN